jgi:hypothetical protein
VKLWHGVGDKLGENHSELGTDVPNVTAIRFLPTHKETMLVTGQETGDLRVWKLSSNTTSWVNVYTVDSRLSHSSAVKRMKFREEKLAKNGENSEFTLATCGSDWTVRVFQI